MIIMKKVFIGVVFSVLSIFIMLALVTGCHPEFVNADNPLGTKSMAGRQKAEQILGYIKDKNSDALKDMFCQELKESDDFDKLLDRAMNFIDGEIISYDKIVGGDGGSGSNWDSLAPSIDNIKTDAGKTYSINISIYFEHENPEKLGIHYLDIWLDCEDTHNGIRTDENNVCFYTE